MTSCGKTGGSSHLETKSLRDGDPFYSVKKSLLEAKRGEKNTKYILIGDTNRVESKIFHQERIFKIIQSVMFRYGVDSYLIAKESIRFDEVVKEFDKLIKADDRAIVDISLGVDYLLDRGLDVKYAKEDLQERLNLLNTLKAFLFQKPLLMKPVKKSIPIKFSK
jgi:hypothetical protein